MVLEITPKRGLAEGKNPEYLYLPTAEHQIGRTLLRVGITSPHDAQIRIDCNELPEKVDEALDIEYLSGDYLPALNRMWARFTMTARISTGLISGSFGKNLASFCRMVS